MATLWAPNTDGERLVRCRVGAAQEGCDGSPGSSVTGERHREGVLWSIIAFCKRNSSSLLGDSVTSELTQESLIHVNCDTYESMSECHPET